MIGAILYKGVHNAAGEIDCLAKEKSACWRHAAKGVHADNGGEGTFEYYGRKRYEIRCCYLRLTRHTRRRQRRVNSCAKKHGIGEDAPAKNDTKKGTQKRAGRPVWVACYLVDIAGEQQDNGHDGHAIDAIERRKMITDSSKT